MEPTMNLDALLHNQDWPKRTDDTDEALDGISKFNPYHDEQGRFSTADGDITGASGQPFYPGKTTLRGRAIAAMGGDIDQGQLFQTETASAEIKEWERHLEALDSKKEWIKREEEKDAKRYIETPKEIAGLDYQPGVWTDEQVVEIKEQVDYTLQIMADNFHTRLESFIHREMLNEVHEGLSGADLSGYVVQLQNLGVITVDDGQVVVNKTRAEELGALPSIEDLRHEIASDIRMKMNSNQGDIAIRVSAEDLFDTVVQDDYLNAFQRGDSSSVPFNSVYRAEIEKLTQNIPSGTRGDKRPVYGYLQTSEHENYDGKVSQYGEYMMGIKHRVRDRATMTVGDSFLKGKAMRLQNSELPNWAIMAMSISGSRQGPLWEASAENTVLSQLDHLPGLEFLSMDYQDGMMESTSALWDFEESGYFEVQIHGGLKVSTDVDYITAPDGGYVSDRVYAAAALINKREWDVDLSGGWGEPLEGSEYNISVRNGMHNTAGDAETDYAFLDEMGIPRT